jgi:hypothetical protein
MLSYMPKIFGSIVLIILISIENSNHVISYSGDALGFILSHPFYRRYDLDFIFELKYTEQVLTLMGWSVLVWQVMYPLLYLNRMTRALLVVYGIFIHIGITLLLNHSYFGPLMIAINIFHFPREFVELYNSALIKLKTYLTNLRKIKRH